MTNMQELIDDHRRALAAFNAVIDEQNRLDEQNILARECEIELLTAHSPAAGSVYGTDEDDIRQQIEAHYHDIALSLIFLDRYNKPVYHDAANLLDDLRAKNLSFIGSAFKSWQIDRQRIKKKMTDLDAQWQEANAAETAAAVALLRHHAANSDEEAERSAYLREARAITGDFNAYGPALLESFLTEPDAAYIVNKVYRSFELGQ